MVDVAVTAGTEDNCVAGEGLQLAGDEVTGDDATCPLHTIVVVGDDVLHVMVSKELHVAQTDLAVQRRGGGQLQLLTCLTTGVVRTGDLHTTEGAGSQGAAVLTGERRTNGVHVVDNADGLVSQAPAVGLAATVVAALHGVLGVAVSGVVVHLLVAGRVNATLCSNGVRTTWGVMVGEDLDVVAQLAEGGSCGTGRQTGTNNNDLELAAVQRGDQLHVVFLVAPHVLHWDAVWLVGLQNSASGDARNNRRRVRERWVFALEFSVRHIQKLL